MKPLPNKELHSPYTCKHPTNNKRRSVAALICLLWICFVRFAGAQTLPLVNYTIQNGLPEATVYSVYIDSAGYLWAGTQGGVCSFDGHQFRIIDAQQGLADNHVTAITGLSNGRLIFGHRSGDLSIYQNGVTQKLRDKKFRNTALIDYLLWHQNKLFVATRGNGLFCISIEKNSYDIKHLFGSDNLPSDTINYLSVKSDHEIWVATTKGVTSINCVSATTTAIKTGPLFNADVTAICYSRGELWVASGGAVLKFADNNFAKPVKSYQISRSPGFHINRILEDHQHTVWLATSSGISKMDKNGITNYDKSNGLLSELVYDIAEDREHNIWFAQDDGISRYQDYPFELFTTQDGLVYNEVYKVIEDDEGKFWIATARGLSVYDPRLGRGKQFKNYTTKEGLPDNFIYDVFQDSHKNIWIACVNYGAVCLFHNTSKFKIFNQRDGFGGKQAVSINEDTKGRVWFATLDGGVSMFDFASRQFKAFKKDSGFPSNAVWTIHRDRKGKLWFGSRDKGLIYLDPALTNFTVVPGQEKLDNHNFGSISSDQQGNIWVASIGSAVFKFDGYQFSQYGSKQGIRSNNPYFIFCDNKDNVWLGTNTGLDLFDPVKLTTKHFLKNDGFLGIETNQNAIYQSRNNDLWIGTVNGLMRYKYTRNEEKQLAPLIYIKKQHLFFDETNLNDNELAYNQNYLTFDYLGISLNNADKVRYSYRLNGFGSAWSPPLTESRVSYANLPPGKYSFMVKAGFPDGNWSKPAQFSFVINSPYYKTWWFILLSAALIIYIGYSLYQYRINQLLKLVNVRNKIASDLHDDIGSALSSISIFSEVADKQLLQHTPPEQTREIISHISHNSRAMLDAMDDIVWAVNPKNDHFDDLAVRMREFAIPLLEARNIAFEFDLPEDISKIRLSMQARKNIFLIFKECVNNTLKHACCTEIAVNFTRVQSWLELSVRDNGKGFDTATLTSRNGLKNMSGRAAEINGTFTITSIAGTGTVATLKVNII